MEISYLSIRVAILIVYRTAKTQRYNDRMQKVGNSLHEVSELPNIDLLSVDYTALLIDIDKEITFIHNYICDKYRHRFPELDSLVHHPIDYAHMVRTIGL